MGECYGLLTSRPYGEGHLLSSHCSYEESEEMWTNTGECLRMQNWDIERLDLAEARFYAKKCGATGISRGLADFKHAH